ncbi:MAG: transcription-repair coupling factor [Bacteroidales bacterium]|nr:transcription-repair coupling factor [Bacteroidales bacterium]
METARKNDLQSLYAADKRCLGIIGLLKDNESIRLKINGLKGSSLSLVINSVFHQKQGLHLLIVDDKELAAYVYNDLENLNGEKEQNFDNRRVLFYPTSYKRPYEIETTDNANILSRTEVLNKISNQQRNLLIITYPEALSEKVITKKFLRKNTISLRKGEDVSLDFLTDILIEYDFQRVDFAVEPGHFAIRGGIVDVFSYSHEYPYRIEFNGDEVESIRTFNPGTQLSLQNLQKISLIPNLQDRQIIETRESFHEFLPESSTIWIDNLELCTEKVALEFKKAEDAFDALTGEIKRQKPSELFTNEQEFVRQLLRFQLVGIGSHFLKHTHEINFSLEPQPVFNKNFELLSSTLIKNSEDLYYNFICSENPKQIKRLETIFHDMRARLSGAVLFKPVYMALHEGFIDHELKLAIYTDHQIFERFHRYRLREGFSGKESLTLKELYNLQPGDFVTHIDHGIGKFDGLEIIENNGKHQEAIRLMYRNGDVLYVSIHSLHRISKFSGKDGTAPVLHRLGSNVWNNLKSRTKQKVKDIARDLIQLYAARKASNGFAFSPDTYLQHELEASFLYEDTPDQEKSTMDLKADMEQNIPMDRLVCGDVGFGKTEVAIRAAFKAVADSKQVAILVPTTILALQHWKTFSERLADFPCRVDYLNRFKTAASIKSTLKDVKDGKIDILIGTHRLLSNDVEYSDLGLVIIDEEQKFGVSAKEKLRKLRVNVDTLTLTATPIPRTLQFSLLGARDLSVINTPPPNRQPVQTEIRGFGEDVIRDAIRYELMRGGQVFFVHNRIQNIYDVAGMLKKFVPDAKIAVAHGQLEGRKLESTMLDFIEGDYDVLVSTTIIESGLDISNANTIIINDAHHYGLSDLHQLRGRVGRSNKKAFCYLLSPPLSSLSDESRKRLRAIEEFSNLGSGFNIAMRDLDIRGAGNLLGGEQSGFISDIGYEMYQKILDEAISELKESEFKGLFKDDLNKPLVSDCQIETDLEVLIPVNYVGNLTERLSLYKEIDGINKEEDLEKFTSALTDRFGPMPLQVIELANALRLRWLAKEWGVEKLVMKNNMLTLFFISKPDSEFFQSEKFTRILKYVQTNPRGCRMKENKDKLTLGFGNILSIADALAKFKELIR